MKSATIDGTTRTAPTSRAREQGDEGRFSGRGLPDGEGRDEQVRVLGHPWGTRTRSVSPPKWSLVEHRPAWRTSLSRAKMFRSRVEQTMVG